MLLVLPLILELPPMMFTENFNSVQVLIALPFWIGAAAASGYLYAWSGAYDPIGSSRLASLGGLVSIFAIVPFPFAVALLVASLLMLRRFGRGVGGPHFPPDPPLKRLEGSGGGSLHVAELSCR